MTSSLMLDQHTILRTLNRTLELSRRGIAPLAGVFFLIADDALTEAPISEGSSHFTSTPSTIDHKFHFLLPR